MADYTKVELATARVKRTLDELKDLGEEIGEDQAMVTQTENFIAREARLRSNLKLERMLESNEQNMLANIRGREIDAVIEHNTRQNARLIEQGDHMIEQNDTIIDLLQIRTAE